jgi:hypothetical protein
MMDKNKEDWESTHNQLKSHLLSIKVQIRNLREDERVEGKEPTLNPEIARLIKAYVRFVRLIYVSATGNPFLSELQEVYHSLEKVQPRSPFKDFFTASSHKQTLTEHNHRIEEAFRSYSVKFSKHGCSSA